MKNFEDLEVYQKARVLTNRIYEITRSGAFLGDHLLADQIRRAVVSIKSNIAERFERGTNAEFIQFLFIAKGSCGEVRAQLETAYDQRYIDETIYRDLADICRGINAMIISFVKYLKSSKIKDRNLAK